MAVECMERWADVYRDRWVRYPQADDVERRARAALLTAGRISPHCLLIHGAPGAGCSTLAERIFRQLGGRGTNQMKVVRVQTPTFADPQAIYTAVLDATSSFVPSGNATTLRRAVEDNLTAVGAELLMLEEVGNLSVALAEPMKGALACIRGLANSRRALICVGASMALRAMANDPQLNHRFRVVELRALAKGGEFETFVGKLTASMSLQHPTDWSTAMLDDLHAMTRGLPGRIAPIIEEAAFLAIATGEDRITHDLLRSPQLSELLRSPKQGKAERGGGGRSG